VFANDFFLKRLGSLRSRERYFFWLPFRPRINFLIDHESGRPAMRFSSSTATNDRRRCSPINRLDDRCAMLDVRVDVSASMADALISVF
jgi:hypothetical protein